MKLYSLSRTLTRSGAGLGNELIPAAKAYLCAQALGASQVPHSWSWNPRGYRALLDSSRFDALPPRLAEWTLPTLEITREAWLSSRIEDYGGLCEKLVREHRFPRFSPVGAVIHSGMWGGYGLINRAKPWIRALLASAKGAEDYLERFERSLSGTSFRVGLHIRRGDFLPMGSVIRGRFNVAIPLEWYQMALDAVLPLLPKDSVVCTFSDAPLPAKKGYLPAGSSGVGVWQADFPGHDTGDLLALASCDLIICSISSFSLMAAWLGNKPFIWLKDQMEVHGDRLSIWGQEADTGNWLQQESLQVPRGTLRSPCIPFSMDGSFDEGHLASILGNGFSNERAHNPILYGCTW